MNTLLSTHEEHTASHTAPLAMDEGLMATLYDRTQMIMNVFVEDGLTCMEMTHKVFRDAQTHNDMSEAGVYGLLVQAVQSVANKRSFLEGVSHNDVLCWLLKETSDLRYADISEITGMERAEVASAIAGVRGRLLS